MEKKIINSYAIYLFVFRLFFSFFHATYMLFLLEKGMSWSQIGVINMVFLIGMFVFEVPTGVVADNFGRKKSVVAGIFVTAIGLLVYYVVDSFLWFCVAEGFAALGCALMSGSLEAWIKTTLNANGSTKSSSEVFSFGEKIGKIGTIVGGMAGGFVGYYSLSLPLLISSIGLVFSGFVTIKIIDESSFKREAFSVGIWKKHMKETVTGSLDIIGKQRNILNLIFVSVLLMIGVQSLNMMWSPYFETEIGYYLIPYMWGLIQGSMLLGIFVINYCVKRKVPDKLLVVISTSISAVGVLLCGLLPYGWLVLMFFVTHEFSRGAYLPLEKAYLQDNIHDETKRATVASFQSMIVRFAAGIAWLTSGIVADYMSIQNVWLLSSIPIFVAIIFARRLK
jgi:MFS family permease